MELSRECLHRSEAAQLLKRIMLFQSERAVNNKRLERKHWNGSQFCRGYLCYNCTVRPLPCLCRGGLVPHPDL